MLSHWSPQSKTSIIIIILHMKNLSPSEFQSNSSYFLSWEFPEAWFFTKNNSLKWPWDRSWQNQIYSSLCSGTTATCQTAGTPVKWPFYGISTRILLTCCWYLPVFPCAFCSPSQTLCLGGQPVSATVKTFQAFMGSTSKWTYTCT